MNMFKYHATYSFVGVDGMGIETGTITLSKGYQLTLPARSRKKYGLKPGQKFQMIDSGKEIILRPIRKHSIRELFGKFKETKGFDSTAAHDILVTGS